MATLDDIDRTVSEQCAFTVTSGGGTTWYDGRTGNETGMIDGDFTFDPDTVLNRVRFLTPRIVLNRGAGTAFTTWDNDTTNRASYLHVKVDGAPVFSVGPVSGSSIETGTGFFRAAFGSTAQAAFAAVGDGDVVAFRVGLNVFYRPHRDVIYRESATAPATPTGGEADEDHLPAGWSRTVPASPTNQVYQSVRQVFRRSDTSAFHDAGAWGMPSEYEAPTVSGQGGFSVAVGVGVGLHVG